MRGAKPVAAATLAVAVLPGLVAGGLQAAGLIEWWLSIALAVALSMAAGAVGAAWWARRPRAHEVVFADLMVWGWLRRRRAERRVASARWLLGSAGRFGSELQAALLERLSGALEAGDARIHGHSKRVARHAHMIAERLGLPPAETARIRAAALVHDVGKLDTPQEILNKPGRLTALEHSTIKRHAARGAQMVSTLGDDQLTAIVRHHHERLDGCGYPDGLRGDEIPIGARIIAVADTFDALTSNRPYRSAYRHKEALDVLRAEAGAQLDPDVVSAFLDYYSGKRPFVWWSPIAAVPSRLSAWALAGLQGATAAPLGAGAAALGAAFVAGGAFVAGSGNDRPVDPLEPATTPGLVASIDPPERSTSTRPAESGSAPGRPADQAEPAAPPAADRDLRLPADGPVPDHPDPPSRDESPAPPAPVEEDGGGSGDTTGEDTVPGGAAGPRGDGVASVPPLPSLPSTPALPPLPTVPVLPQVGLPALPQVESGVSQVRLP